MWLYLVKADTKGIDSTKYDLPMINWVSVGMYLRIFVIFEVLLATLWV